MVPIRFRLPASIVMRQQPSVQCRPVRLPTVTEDPTMTRVLSNRNLNRSIHVGLGALLGCYVYWPEFREHPAGAIATQAVVLPLVTLSGLWLWKGKQVLR